MQANIIASESRARPGEDALLLREFAHRAFNEVAVASSAVTLARRGAGCERAAVLLVEAEDRLEGVGRALRLLARPVEARVELAAELADLCHAMRAARDGADRTRIDLDAPELWVDGAVARRILVIAAELVGNAFRHALAGRDGTLSVRLRRRSGELILDVADDGGSGPRHGTTSGTGWGSVIIAELARTAGGAVTVGRGAEGTLATVRIPVGSGRELAVAR